MAELHQELKRPGVTLQRLHLEYLAQHPTGYRYSQFCRHYERWVRTLKPTMRQVHRAGEKAFVDFSGKRPVIVDPRTGELIAVELFVGVLGASSYVYAEACPAEDLPAWITAHVRMVEFFGGTPALFVPDNLLSGVTIGPISVAPFAEELSHGAVPVMTTSTAKGTSAGADGDLHLVVAVFRHGIRAPLEAFAKRAGDHSAKSWPLLPEWVGPGSGLTWGDLTPHGREAVVALGGYHGTWYSREWGKDYRVYLWADVDTRTPDTADALARGFNRSGIQNVTLGIRTDGEQDPLFHAYRAQCGRPNAKILSQIAADINNNWQEWHDRYKLSFVELYESLGCVAPNKCTPLSHVMDSAQPCLDQQTCSAPIRWTGKIGETEYAGRFPYASSASEAFLLEFANGMRSDKVGWGNVAVLPPPFRDKPSQLRDMLHLHEIYFDRTERQPDLALMQGSNLVREILVQFKRKAGQNIDGQRPRASGANQFVGLVGHDTNLAQVGSLLGLGWYFYDERRPLTPDTLFLPPNHALPAGALVFELRRCGFRKHDNSWFVRIEYATQTLLQMRSPSNQGDPFRLAVSCRDETGKYLSPCQLTLDAFTTLVTKALGVTILISPTAPATNRHAVDRDHQRLRLNFSAPIAHDRRSGARGRVRFGPCRRRGLADLQLHRRGPDVHDLVGSEYSPEPHSADGPGSRHGTLGP
jgi:Histidine phosphatase superfamily (branch 2)